MKINVINRIITMKGDLHPKDFYKRVLADVKKGTSITWSMMAILWETERLTNNN